MSTLEALIRSAREQGASDLHLEAGLPPAFRLQGELRMRGEKVSTETLLAWSRQLLVGPLWEELLVQQSCDLSRVIEGVRCRINVFRTARGLGLAVRLLTSFQATLRSLNLHPDLAKLAERRHGLVLVSGPTGSGKSSTLAALLQEINLTQTRHILTVESPIEYALTPHSSLIRQRQVGRDTPSFERALVDALREDPDVLMVGEMRDPETMRLTLNAAETGHLVLSTLHSATTAEAAGRVVSAFPAEVQSGISAQLADCLAAIICQRLELRPALGIRVPVCEILLPSSGVRAMIRTGQFTKIITALESGGHEGQWTVARYRAWLDARTDWVLPAAAAAMEPGPPTELPDQVAEALQMALQPAREVVPTRPSPRPSVPRASPPRAPAPARPPPEIPAEAPSDDGRLVIDEEEDPEALLARLK